MNIIIKLIRHRNHGGYKSVMTSYARAVQPSRMSNNLYTQYCACKYNKEVVRHSLSTTAEIISNEHLDYFYLMIKQRISPHVVLPSSFIIALLIPGNWRAVEPEATWPHTFIGHFPKKPFETEREREWRLNQQVRMPFKKTLGGMIQGIPDPQILFSILFTRACKYTDL